MVGGNGPDEKGIMPQVFDHVFHLVNVTNAKDDGNKGIMKVLIRCSFVEIYNEEIRDLLSKYILLRFNRFCDSQ